MRFRSQCDAIVSRNSLPIHEPAIPGSTSYHFEQKDLPTAIICTFVAGALGTYGLADYDRRQKFSNYGFQSSDAHAAGLRPLPLLLIPATSRWSDLADAGS